MRAHEFLTEQEKPVEEISAPMRHAYALPGVFSSNAYQNYRLGVAVARAASDQAEDSVNEFRPEWSAETAFGQNAVVVGNTDQIGRVIDLALKMTNTPGGKKLIVDAESTDPASTNTQSTVKPFKGYPR